MERLVFLLSSKWASSFEVSETKRSFFLLCLLIVASHEVSAIAPEEKLSTLTLTHWGAQHGIPEETSSALLAPGDGYVWIASNNGLIRFDGRQGRVFRLGDMFRPKGTASCSSNTVNSLLLGPDGHIWAGPGSGCILQIRRDRFGGFTNLQVVAMESPDPDRQSTSVRALRPGPDGRSVEVARLGGISTIRLDDVDLLAASLQPPATSPSIEQRSIAAPPGNRLLHTGRNSAGVLWAIAEDGQLLASPPGSRVWMPQVRWAGNSGAIANRLLVSRSGAVWISSDRGLFRWQDGAIRTWTSADGLPHGTLLGLLEDRAGCLWIGGQGSVSRLCGGRLETVGVGAEQTEAITTMVEDPSGNLWLGGRWGNLYRLTHSIFQVFTRREGLRDSHFTGVTTANDGVIWGSTREGGLVRIVEGRVVPEPVRPGVAETQAVLAHPAGGVLAATVRGLFHAGTDFTRQLRIEGPIDYNGVPALAWAEPGTLLFSHHSSNFRLIRRDGSGGDVWRAERLQGPLRIRQWTRDAQGRTWALSQYAGLHRLEGTAYVPAPNADPGKARAWFSLARDRQGLLWIGTTDGLEIYSPAESRFLTAKPILFGDQVFHITEDNFGKIWCATRQGLVRFGRGEALALAGGAPQDGFFPERFDGSHALPTTNFGLVTSATGTTGPDGRLWFPGLLGMISVQPADFVAVPRAPAAVLRQLNADGVPVDLNRQIEIPPGNKRLEFIFQTLRLDPLGGEFCRVRLEGLDHGWNPCNLQRTQQYTSLPPADYEFVVQTSSRGGTWNGQTLRVPVTVRPAYHQLLWVRLLAATALLALIGAFVWHRQKQLLDRNRWLEEKVEERTATLVQATEAAQAANRAKTEFLATMSHEIRTPMNGVLGAVQILDESRLDADQKKLVSVIRGSGEDLIGIVDDILCLAKVEAGKLCLERTPVDLVALGESLVSLFGPKAAAKNVHLAFSAGPGVPAYLLSDPQRLRQILLNLLGNAVKFTDQGEVRLRITADPEAGQITFHVEDTGAGIPAETIPALFEPFVQADSSTTRRYGGSGLGLSIVHRFVDAMGGTIAVDSEVGRGSTFRIHLPLEPALGPELPIVDSPADPHPASGLVGEGLTVLLVEDNPVNQMIAQKMLVRCGSRVLVANDGNHALTILRARRVDLVLMDCQMPGLDGYQASRAIRSWGGEFAQLPIIAITASAMEDERRRCEEAGMNDFLSKPLMLKALESVLSRWNGLVAVNR
jgi:signal transduction histidine kinase/CheY-like chemotaxis protein/ligand-binding sensor domain-containing protein